MRGQDSVSACLKCISLAERPIRRKWRIDRAPGKHDQQKSIDRTLELEEEAVLYYSLVGGGAGEASCLKSKTILPCQCDWTSEVNKYATQSSAHQGVSASSKFAMRCAKLWRCIVIPLPGRQHTWWGLQGERFLVKTCIFNATVLAPSDDCFSVLLEPESSFSSFPDGYHTNAM
jgi:hypothetical protein